GAGQEGPGAAQADAGARADQEDAEAMTARGRLLATLLATTLLLLAPALYGVSRLGALRDIAIELRGQHARALLTLRRLHVALAQFERHQGSYIATTLPDLRDGMYEALHSARQELDQLASA